MINRRELLVNVGAASTLLAGTAATGPTFADTTPATGAESAKLFLPADRLQASTADRLPLSWSKERFRTLQARLGAGGYDGILLTDEWNVIYFTGLFHTTTERMIHAFIPTVGDHPVWFYPALDRDLIRT